MQKITSIADAQVEGKRVLLRTSLNVPIRADGTVGDLFRLRAALPTIEWLSRHGASTCVLAHLGRDGASLKPVVEILASLTTVPIQFFGGSLAEARAHPIAPGSCVVLENIRIHPEEEDNDQQFANALAQLGDLYVDDAFADAHRPHASIVSVPKLLPSYAGLLMLKEIERITPAVTPPSQSLAIIGGAKFETKEPLIAQLLTRYERVLLGGALANDLLKTRGLPIGSSRTSAIPIPVAIAENEQLVAPKDAVLVDDALHRHRCAGINDVRIAERIVDIGPETAGLWESCITQAAFVVWNGPMGIYEDGFVDGTDALAEALSRANVPAVVGGGDTLAALQKIAFDPEKIFLSTGGGALLEFLTTGTLAGIEALRRV